MLTTVQFVKRPLYGPYRGPSIGDIVVIDIKLKISLFHRNKTSYLTVYAYR